MHLKEQKIWALYSDTSLQEVEAAFVVTDGLDILKVENSFCRPYSYELKDKLLNITPDQLADKNFLDILEKEVSDFFIAVLKEGMESVSQKADYISVMGPVVALENKHALEIGDFERISATFGVPVIGHFVQSDLTNGGVGSPLNTLFWEAMARQTEKPVVVVNVGGILKINFLGPNGEISAFDVGIGTALMDEWVFRKTGQSQDEGGWLSAQGKADNKVVKMLLKHPFFNQKPPKAVRQSEFEDLLQQLEGLTPANGCATLVAFFVESLKKARRFLPEEPKTWILTGGGLKNPSLVLALQQAFPNVQKAADCFVLHEHLNGIGTAFLAARYLMHLPISLPTTTGVTEAVSIGEVFDPVPDK